MADNWNYPEGADGPDAPWNQPDPVPCPECEGTGKIIDTDEPLDSEDREWTCSVCDGLGEVDPRTLEDDPDDERDRREDDRLTGWGPHGDRYDE